MLLAAARLPCNDRCAIIFCRPWRKPARPPTPPSRCPEMRSASRASAASPIHQLALPSLHWIDAAQAPPDAQPGDRRQILRASTARGRADAERYRGSSPPPRRAGRPQRKPTSTRCSETIGIALWKLRDCELTRSCAEAGAQNVRATQGFGARMRRAAVTATRPVASMNVFAVQSRPPTPCIEPEARSDRATRPLCGLQQRDVQRGSLDMRGRCAFRGQRFGRRLQADTRARCSRSAPIPTGLILVLHE